MKYPDYFPEGRVHSPLSISSSRRVQTLSALIHCSSILLFPCLYFYLWTRESVWPFLFVYSLYSFILDDTQSTGVSVLRASVWMKNAFIYKGFIDYFPIITHRSVPLPESVKYQKVTKICLPQWSRWLPSVIKKVLEMIGLIFEKERVVIEEQPIGPRYIFACHPHGVIAFGITGTMCWDGESKVHSTVFENGKIVKDEYATPPVENDPLSVTTTATKGLKITVKSSKSFRSLFPNIPTHLLTLSTQFMLPFYRDYIMALGVGLVTKTGISSILKRWHSVAIVVGGAHESLLAKPGSNKIVLNRRKGFIKIALELCNKDDVGMKLVKDQEDFVKKGKWNEEMSDMAVVPVYVYGENSIHNVFNTVEGKNTADSHLSPTMNILLTLQLSLKKYTGFTIPIVNSRSIFNYDFGLLPYKRRVDVVFGEPIYIYRRFGAKVGDEVTEEEVNYYHDLYKKKLMQLWKEKKGFSTKWDEDLQIVE